MIGPIWSSDDANATSPYLETSPYVGFSPTTPQKLAGCLIEPPVSEPSAHGTRFAATAAADPPEEPPGTLFKFQGFLVFLKYEYSVEPPMANSSMFSFPKSIIFSAFNFSTTVASYGETKFSNILELHVVFTPFVHMLSFIPIGIPAKSPLISPLSIFSCTSFACSNASSVSVVTNACTSSSLSFILSTYAFVISVTVSSLFFNFSCNSCTVNSVISITFSPFTLIISYYLKCPFGAGSF